MCALGQLLRRAGPPGLPSECDWSDTHAPHTVMLLLVVSPGLRVQGYRLDGHSSPAHPLLLPCRFVSRIFVVPNHPELLLSSSGVSAPLPAVYPRWLGGGVGAPGGVGLP